MTVMLFLILGLIVGVLTIGLVKYISPASRENRRRRRNYGRTVAKANRPMVKFTVDVPGKKE